MSKKKIVHRLNVSKPTIIKWLGKDEYLENRGWKKGKSRKYDDDTVSKQICELKELRIKEKKYFTGSQYIQMDYANTYPENDVPSIWFIDETIRKAGLQTRQPKLKKKKGGSKYLLYPAESIKSLSGIHQSADFIGKKYIVGSSKPVNIFSSNYYCPFKLYQIKPILAEKVTYAIECLKEQWQKYPIPNVFRKDNGLQFRGTSRGKRCIGTFLKFLLNLNVTPLFSAPSKPWTNPHVEGHNRVFNEKVWSRNHFTDREQIDTECSRFNQESLDFFKYRYGQMILNNDYQYLKNEQETNTDELITTKGKKIYFIRFVESIKSDKDAYVIILNERVSIPEQYNHQFVFVQWNLETEHLLIYSEYDGAQTLIKEMKFKINR